MDEENVTSSMETAQVEHHGRILNWILSHAGVRDAKNRALAAGIPFWQIITTILPFVIQFITTGKIDWQAVIAAILALIPHP